MPLNSLLKQEIEDKEKEHTALQQSFDTLSFAEKMKLFGLKGKLGQLCLEAAGQLPLEDERLLRGAYLRKTVKYNPFLKPNLVDDPRLVYLDFSNIGKPLPKTNAENIKDIGKGVGLFFGIAAAMLPMLFLFIPAVTTGVIGHGLNYPYTYWYEKKQQENYVKRHCLKPISYTPDECISLAITHLDKGEKNETFLAIRYLLEAEIRSETPQPEIAHYLARCFQHLREEFSHSTGEVMFNPLEDRPRRIMGIAGEGTPDEELLWPRLYEIKTYVMQNNPSNQPKANSPLKFIWELQEPTADVLTHDNCRLFYCNTQNLRSLSFHSLLIGRLTHEHPDYQVTLVELAQYLRQKLFAAYPQMLPFDGAGGSVNILPQCPAHKTTALKNIPLVQLVAYMDQVYEVPEDCMKAAVANSILLGGNATSADDSAAEYLQQRLQKAIDVPVKTNFSAFHMSTSQNNNHGNISMELEQDGKIVKKSSSRHYL